MTAISMIQTCGENRSRLRPVSGSQKVEYSYAIAMTVQIYRSQVFQERKSPRLLSKCFEFRRTVVQTYQILSMNKYAHLSIRIHTLLVEKIKLVSDKPRKKKILHVHLLAQGICKSSSSIKSFI